MHPLEGVEEDRLSSYAYVLARKALKMHLDPALCLVIGRHVAEPAEIEIRAQFPVETRENVQIERGGHAVRVIIRQMEEAAVLLEVVADKERIAFVQQLGKTGLEARAPPVGRSCRCSTRHRI